MTSTRSRTALLVATIVCSAALPSIVRAQDQSLLALRASEEQMHDAYVHHKTQLFASLYADDATFIYNSGRLASKAERVDGFDKAPPFLGEQDVIEKIRVYGDVAIVTCLTTYPDTAKTQLTALLITRVWQHRAGRWQVVSFQSTRTPMPSGATPTQEDRITFAVPR